MQRRNVVGLVVAAAAVGAVAAPGRAQAQEAVVTGRVISDRGQPVVGATVLLSELGIGGLTNSTGNFTLSVPAARVRGQSATLLVRYIGFIAQRRQVTLSAGRQAQQFTLVTDANRLTEVVVTGTTVATEARKIPYAVSQVNAADMPVPAANPISQLQGKVPGANIVNNSGRPGAAPAVVLRGPTSINASGRSQEPLYILDGVMLQSGVPDLNPLDIESVEVVKGAAAASIYGSRAGNGVIQIRTKSGRGARDGTRVGFRTEYGAGDIPRRPPLARYTNLLLDETGRRYCVSGTGGVPAGACQQTVDWDAETLRINQNGIDNALNPVGLLGDGGIALAPTRNQLRNSFQAYQFPRTYNTLDQITTDNQLLNNQVDVTGRYGKTSVFASVNAFNQEAAIRGLTGFRRQSVRVNADQQLGDRWTVTANTFYSRSWADGANQSGTEFGDGGGNATGFFAVTRTPANVNILANDNLGRLYVRPNLANQAQQNGNPLYSFLTSRQTDESDRFIGATTVRFQAATWLDLDANFNADRSNSLSSFIRDRGTRNTVFSQAVTDGFGSRGTFLAQSYNTGAGAVLKRDIRDLSARLSLRTLYEQQDNQGTSGSGTTIAVPGLNDLNATTANFAVGSSKTSVRQISYFSGLNLDFKGRYILDAGIRRDGTSLLGADNRWQNLGNARFAWRASEEPFLRNLPGINDLKFRVAWGQTANRPNFSAQYETFAFGTGGVLLPQTLGNRNLRPEVVTETEVGFDAELKRNIGLNVTYAYSTADGQLDAVRAPASSGFVTQWRNIGLVTNRTIEASLNVPWVQGRALNWSTRFNYDRNRAILTRLDVPTFDRGPNFQGIGAAGEPGMFRFEEGIRLGTMFGRDFVRSCSQLPASFAAQCGGSGSQFQQNQQGYIVWTGGFSPTEGIERNLWNTSLPIQQAPWFTPDGGGRALGWGLPILLQDATGRAARVPLGNSMPDYRLAMSNTVSYKRLSAYALVDASVGQVVYNQGLHWSLGDFATSAQDQFGKSVQDALPSAYYWRAGFSPRGDGNGLGLGGFYDILGPNRETVEKATFTKLREVSLSYRLGAIRGRGDFNFSVIGRNLLIFTNYRGFDPEVGIQGGPLNSPVLNAVDRYGFPNLRQVTFSIGTTL
mgnify:CR=1 FL=1